MGLKFLYVLLLMIKILHVIRTDLSSWKEDQNNNITTEEALGQMAGEISRQFFSDFHCLAVITEINRSNPTEIFMHLPINEVPMMHLHFSRDVRFKRDTDDTEEYSKVFSDFEELLLASLNLHCTAYIIQVPDLVFMVEMFREISRWASQRVNRHYLYLPTVIDDLRQNIKDWEEGIQGIFPLRTMDFMPDLVVVKIIPSENYRELTNIASREESEDYSDNLNEEGVQSSSNVDFKNNILEFSDHETECKRKRCCHFKISNNETDEDLENNNDTFVDQMAVPRREVHLNEVRFEVITHKFKWPNPEEVYILDTWVSNRGFLQNKNLYPDKLTDLMGKPFYITTLPYPPFAVLDVVSIPPVNDGFEFRVVNEYIKKHNMTYIGVYDLDNWWGEIWPNGSGEGLSGLVAEDKADIGFAAVYLWNDEYRFTDYSDAYGWSGITVVAPRPVPLPAIMVPLLPFSPGMWLAVAVYIVVTTLVLYIISNATEKLLGGNITSKYSTIWECAFRTVGLLVLQVPNDERHHNVPRHTPMRHLVNWLILQFLVITTAYGGGLAMVLTLPRFTPPIETAGDLAASGLPWAALDDAFVFGIKESPDPVLRTLTRNFYAGSEEELSKRTRTADMAFVVERLQGGRFALPPHITQTAMEHLRLMKEDIFWGHCVFMVRKGTPHMKKFNKVVNHLKESGIILHWEIQVVREFLNERQQLSVIQSRVQVDLGPTKLHLDHVQGAYILLGLGMGLAVIAFIAEITYSRLIQ